MTCTKPDKTLNPYYDLKLLSQAVLPMDCLIHPVSSKRFHEMAPLRSKNTMWPMLFDITPEMVDYFKEEAVQHIKTILEKPDIYGYFYFISNHEQDWYNAPQFDYKEFPLTIKKHDVLQKIHTIAEYFSKPRTTKYDATCLYLLYFYAVLANPHLNWITIDYIANGNRYHQLGTRLKGTMRECTKRRWTK